MQIRNLEPVDLDSVVQLSLRAWEPVFASIEQSLQPEVYRCFFPDWREEQKTSVETVCRDPEAHVWVAESAGRIAGFSAVYRRTPTYGEIYMIAVDPEFQKCRVGAQLTEHSVAWMQQQGIQVAMVETGADPGHGPARRLYESQGFRLWPVARYFRYLA